MNTKFFLLGAALSLTAHVAFADPLRVRGTVSAFDGSVAVVENAAGQSIEVKLTEPVVLMYRDISLSDLPQNAYIAVPSIDAPDGNRRALGVIVFPEQMRGMNEGFKVWDLGPESKMTNATVAQVVARGGENILTVTYGGEQQTIYVPTSAPINSFSPDPDEKISVGDNVVIFADESDGVVSGKFVGKHENGGLPPV
ncbi:hypothetical protein [Litoreibacter roseus]|uniref:DUF5666 domain-containing protein n=1 Tax=Litoreibacter roseus TaxID=2601869 RepID=A0A6N6JLM7_9RHOB|nr:hypothetical protein [Litoreibacter roseus]GFE67024.1 hypothetical protein KIN_40980 [Litoreibacter roseus]